MAHVLIRHKVANFARWKRAYDAHSAARRKAGFREKTLLRSVRNPREVFILLQAGDLKKAKSFVKSRDLHKAMKNAGVVGKPEFTILR
jgi:heme-degrading monooxygenase HmoA